MPKVLSDIQLSIRPSQLSAEHIVIDTQREYRSLKIRKGEKVSH